VLLQQLTYHQEEGGGDDAKGLSGHIHMAGEGSELGEGRCCWLATKVQSNHQGHCQYHMQVCHTYRATLFVQGITDGRVHSHIGAGLEHIEGVTAQAPTKRQ
jgi:hypothetical protein